ncbi:thiol-disulfide isomerase/thioredoxin [Pedobacter sp. UYP30]|uniref:TlpA family protein disulfide reductase n=1 Tax=Pedobacter sp. UYP30 TaxID=1756400 RepID=UPI003394807E
MVFKFLKKNGLTIVFFSFVLIVLFVPSAKALMLQGLMKTGLFAPKIAQTALVSTDLAGITFSNEKGQLLDLGDLKGKVILLNFWATWCPPCRAEMPGLSKLYKQFEKDKNVVFIFADADGDLNKSAKFMRRNRYDLPIYKLESDIPTKVFERTLPTTVIFDKQGRLSFRHEGMADYSDAKFVDFLNKLKGLN